MIPLPPPPGRLRIYVRVSTDEQVNEGYSIDAQIEACIQWGLKRGFSPPFCLYVDYGLSAGSMEKRAALRLLLTELEDSKTSDTMVTKFLDRAWRDVADAAASLKRIKASGGSLVMLDFPIDTSTMEGEIFFYNLSSFAQYERKRIGKRVHDTNLHIVSQHRRWVGGRAPYGYTYNPDTKLLEIHETQAEAVRLVFERYTKDRHGSQRICKELNRKGYVTNEGNPWQSTSLLCLLRNPVYAGFIAYGRGAKVRASSALVGAPDDAATWILVQGKHEPIISLETWEAAKERLRSRGPGRAPSRQHLLSGIVVCAACSSPMYARPRGDATQIYLGCGKVSRYGREACPEGAYLLHSLLEEAVLDALSRNLANARAKGFTPRNRARAKNPTEARAHKRKHWLDKRDRITDAYIAGGLSPERYRAQLKDLEGQLQRLEEDAEPPVLPEVDPSFDFEALMRSPDLTAEEKRSGVAAFVERILIGNEAVEIHYKPFGLVGWKETERLDRQEIREKWRPSRRNSQGRFTDGTDQ
ncbi:MAG: recombinase family protein [Armatimonadetes bacterium]|nr:recombinase family protein [Armatimonadota bacterium]